MLTDDFRDPKSARMGDRVILVFDDALREAMGTNLADTPATICAQIDDPTVDDVAVTFFREDHEARTVPYVPHASSAPEGAAHWLWPAEHDAAQFIDEVMGVTPSTAMA